MSNTDPIPCPHSNFALCVLTFRIIVLTWNRPASLLRLLTSLDNSDYHFKDGNQHWSIELEIHRDGGGGLDGEKTLQIAQEFQFSHGYKVIDVTSFKS